MSNRISMSNLVLERNGVVETQFKGFMGDSMQAN